MSYTNEQTTIHESLKKAVSEIKKKMEVEVANAEAALEEWEDKPENNVYADFGEAEYVIGERMCDRARAACEGSYCHGMDEYECEFFVEGVLYLGTVKMEYNRHDKTYYYIDESRFSYARVG